MPVELISVLNPQEVPPGERIGLRELLFLEKQRRTEFYPIGLSAIQDALREVLDVQLPETLVDQLGLDRLNWGRVTLLRESTKLSSKIINSILFVGKGEGKTTLQNALGTIEFTRMIRHMDSGGPRLEIRGVRIGGIAHDSMENPRVLGVRYSCFSPDDYNAFRFDISLSKEELWRSAERAGGSQTREIPTDFSRPYSTAALITKAMVDEVRGHDTVLAVFYERGWGIRDLGVASEGGNYVLKYRVEDMEPLWEISIPKSLQRTTE